MLMSTPTKHHHMPHRNPPSSYHNYFTPRTDSSCSFDSPMLTPSPLRHHHKPFIHEAEDLFLASPFKSPARAHPYTSSGNLKPQPISPDDEEGAIFLSSSPTPMFSPRPFTTPSKQPAVIPTRPVLSIKPLNVFSALDTSSAAPAESPTTATRAGVGTKRKSTPHTTPLRAHNLSPLKVTSSGAAEHTATGAFPFDRLAPLTAPKFNARTPQTKAETDAYLRRQTATLTKLKLTDQNNSDDEFGLASNDSGCEMDEDDEAGDALFLSRAVALGKLSGKGPLGGKGKSKEEVAAAISPGGHVTKRRARSRPVSAELHQTMLKPPKSPTRSNSVKHRQRHAGSVAFPTSSSTHRTHGSPGSSSSETGSPRPRRRVSGATAKTLPPLFQNSLMPHAIPPRSQLSRIESSSSATLFFGPPIPQASTSAPVVRSRTTTSAAIPASTLQTSIRPKPNRHSYAGPGTELTWNTIQSRSQMPSPRSSPSQGDLSFHSPSLDDEDMFFGVGPQDSSFVFNVTEGTPSPRIKKALPKKYQPRDSGIVVSDDEDMPSTGSSVAGDYLHVMPRASTSVTSVCSFDDGLVTPGAGPDSTSGWPGTAIYVQNADDAGCSQEGGVDVDAFIIRTLAAASKDPGDGTKKKIPGTPVKKTRTIAIGDRLWQSAVAPKVGLRDDCDFVKKKAPRKSLPAAFPPPGRASDKSVDSTDSEGEDESPSGRRKEHRYGGVGLGRPTPAAPKDGLSAIPRSRWLMRRSSSGGFSSGSDSASMGNTPTRAKGTDWQLPKPRVPVHFSPTRSALRLASSSGRSASGSSTSSSTPTLNSPTNGTRRFQLPISGPTAPRPSLIATRRRSYEPFEEEQPGRFERDFVEVDEVGSGEFGKVIKVRCKTGDDAEVFAIKKSKRFEGAKHRLRLREEVDILKHLSQAAECAGLDGRHPNVLGYIDSWEEEEALYIRTELCESGNLARFLWEYGRAFPRLDEARVWKIVADLSNGLRFIHDAGVIHLDLKPSNVFLTREGRFKIGDFGMASVWPRPAVEAAGGGGGGFEREGDKLYLAPEVLQGRYGKAADVFSFGMTVLETTSNIVVPDQGAEWHRLRLEDFSQVTDLQERPELFALIREMMRAEPSLRLSVEGIWSHPIVARARIAMERMYMAAQRDGTDVFAASPLASVPCGFLEEILGRGFGMDVSA